jgi:hypothetical protein
MSDQFAHYSVNHIIKVVCVVPCLSGSDVNVTVITSSIMSLYLHLQPSLPTLVAVTGVIGDGVDTCGVILALIVLALIDVRHTVIALESRAAVAGVRFCGSRAMSAIETFVLEA